MIIEIPLKLDSHYWQVIILKALAFCQFSQYL